MVRRDVEKVDCHHFIYQYNHLSIVVALDIMVLSVMVLSIMVVLSLNRMVVLSSMMGALIFHNNSFDLVVIIVPTHLEIKMHQIVQGDNNFNQ